MIERFIQIVIEEWAAIAGGPHFDRGEGVTLAHYITSNLSSQVLIDALVEREAIGWKAASGGATDLWFDSEQISVSSWNAHSDSAPSGAESSSQQRDFGTLPSSDSTRSERPTA